MLWQATTSYGLGGRAGATGLAPTSHRPQHRYAVFAAVPCASPLAIPPAMAPATYDTIPNAPIPCGIRARRAAVVAQWGVPPWGSARPRSTPTSPRPATHITASSSMAHWLSTCRLNRWELGGNFGCFCQLLSARCQEF